MAHSSPESIANLQKMVDCLNTAFQADPNAMHALIVNRVPCNQSMVDHPHVVCDKSPVLAGDHWQVGMGGVLAGICWAVGSHIIATEWSDETDEDGRKKMTGFRLVDFSETKESVKTTYHPSDAIGTLRSHILDRLSHHRENLKLWKSGFLTPTEPDEAERNCVMRELKAAIMELERIEGRLS